MWITILPLNILTLWSFICSWKYYRIIGIKQMPSYCLSTTFAIQFKNYLENFYILNVERNFCFNLINFEVVHFILHPKIIISVMGRCNSLLYPINCCHCPLSQTNDAIMLICVQQHRPWGLSQTQLLIFLLRQLTNRPFKEF